jgi:hypothetical protein
VSIKGENITKAFKFMQTFYVEIADLLIKLDDLMEREYWVSARGDRTTSLLSKNLKNPRKWLPDACFRIYGNKKFPNVRKGIVIDYATEGNKEPVLILGSITYENTRDELDWDLWNLWFESEKHRILYKDYFEAEPESENVRKGVIKNCHLYTINLVDVSDEEDIKNKIFNKLMEF